MNKSLLLLILSLVAGTMRANDDVNTLNLKVEEVKVCFAVKGQDLEASIAETQFCFRAIMKYENWQERFCKVLQTTGYPECFEPTFVNTLKECIAEKDYETFHQGILKMTKTSCDLMKSRKFESRKLENSEDIN